jgi:hypothetical protein
VLSPHISVLNIIVLLSHHIIHNFCKVSLNIFQINWVETQICLKNYLLLVVSAVIDAYKFCITFFLYVDNSKHRNDKKLWDYMCQIYFYSELCEIYVQIKSFD